MSITVNILEIRKAIGQIATDYKKGLVTKEVTLENLQNLNWDSVTGTDDMTVRGKEYLQLYVNNLIHLITTDSFEN